MKNSYLLTSIECISAFLAGTFIVAMFFSHLTPGWLIPGVILVALYIFVLFTCVRLMFKHFSIAVLMLLTPIVPLVALFFVIMLLPLLAKL